MFFENKVFMPKLFFSFQLFDAGERYFALKASGLMLTFAMIGRILFVINSLFIVELTKL